MALEPFDLLGRDLDACTIAFVTDADDIEPERADLALGVVDPAEEIGRDTQAGLHP